MEISEIRERLQDIRSFVWNGNEGIAITEIDELLEEIEKEELNGRN